MRKLVSIQTIKEIFPIEGADKIVLVSFQDIEWRCVAMKDEFKVGDKAIYFEIDSLLPDNDPNFAFMANSSSVKKIVIDGVEYSGYPLKTKKLRGQLSQGLALPINRFTSYKSFSELPIEQVLNIVKYERPLPLEMSGNIKGNFPVEIVGKTDEPRIHVIWKSVAKLLDSDTRFIARENMDGSSITFFNFNGEFRICQRNYELEINENNSFCKAALAFKDRTPDGYAVQAEIVGNGIQKNIYKLQAQELYAYSVFDIEKKKYLSDDEFTDFCHLIGIKTCPVLKRDFLLSEIGKTADEMLKFAEGKSLGNPIADREGVVIRPIQEMTNNDFFGETPNSRVSFKLISNKFLLNS